MPMPSSASRRTVAVILNAFVPGLGHLYLGRLKAGAIYMAVTFVMVLGMIPDIRGLMSAHIPTIDEAMAGMPVPVIPERLTLLTIALIVLFFVSMWDAGRKPKAD